MTEGQSAKLLHQSVNLLSLPRTLPVRRSYFGPDCIKDYFRDLLERETKHSIKINKAMLFTEEDKLYHEADDICHICKKKTVLIKLEITVTKQVDIEAQHVIFVT